MRTRTAPSCSRWQSWKKTSTEVNGVPAPPKQPAGVPWPTDVWPRGALPGDLTVWAEAKLEEAFSPEGVSRIGETHALVVIQGGKLVLERYAEGMGPETTHPSWSKAKSITHGLTGVLVGDGLIDVKTPPGAPEWSGPDDPRGAITWDQLLRMSSGLKFNEVYVPDQEIGRA